MFERRLCSRFRRRSWAFPARVCLLTGMLALVIAFGGCRKRAGQSTVDQVPQVTSHPSPVEAPEEKEPTPPPQPEPEPETPEAAPIPDEPAPTLWETGNLLFSRLDFEDACQAYTETGPELPRASYTHAILACAIGTPEQRELAKNWLQEQLQDSDSPESLAMLHALEKLLAEMQNQDQKVLQQQRRLKQLAEELEMLKKIDSRRRRP